MTIADMSFSACGQVERWGRTAAATTFQVIDYWGKMVFVLLEEWIIKFRDLSFQCF